jgi:hypothetical protein
LVSFLKRRVRQGRVAQGFDHTKGFVVDCGEIKGASLLDLKPTGVDDVKIDPSRRSMEFCDGVVWCSVVLVEEEREDCLRSNAYGVSYRLADLSPSFRSP